MNTKSEIKRGTTGIRLLRLLLLSLSFAVLLCILMLLFLFMLSVKEIWTGMLPYPPVPLLSLYLAALFAVSYLLIDFCPAACLMMLSCPDQDPRFALPYFEAALSFLPAIYYDRDRDGVSHVPAHRKE